jgi:ribosomal protein S18 acetylase RimI-like enzyme
MAGRYWEELMPHAPVIQHPDRRAIYFADHFQLDDPGSIHCWAVLNANVIGFAKIDRWENHDGDGATIRDLFIEAPWRRKGRGSAFVNLIVEMLAEQGIHRIDLNVRVDNQEALTFWRSLGFEISLYQLRRYIPDQADAPV